MKATGTITFKRERDGVISREWTGGRRVTITSGVLMALGVPKPHLGRVVELQPDLQLRIIAMQATEGAYEDTLVAMREGFFAQMIWRYWQWLSDHAFKIFKWECKWLRWREPKESELYPKWSLVGILIRPLL